jgi:hypothetical protein
MLSVLNIDVLRQKCRDIGLLTGEGNVVPVKQLSKEQLHAALRLWSNVRTLPPGNLFDPLVRINDMLVEEAESNPEVSETQRAHANWCGLELLIHFCISL